MTVGFTDGWRFVHGPGLDDPLMGEYGSGTQVYNWYWVTDGNGRTLAEGDSVGSDSASWAQGGYFPQKRYSGAVNAQNSFGADRFSSADAPGVSFFRNRAYDSKTGRWTQEDPIGVAGGVNLYAYAGNNPVMFSDPFGLCPDNLKDNDGKCPGGLSVKQWNQVQETYPNMSTIARRRTATLLQHGQIHGNQLAPEVYGQTDHLTGKNVTINTSHGLFRQSTFNNHTELTKTLIHEGTHVEQFKRLPAGYSVQEYWNAAHDYLDKKATDAEKDEYVPSH